MSAFYREIFSPTVVEHAAVARFTSPDALNLIIACTSMLKVYAIVDHFEEEEDMMLKLIAEYKLHGNITSIGVIKTITSSKWGLDSLLLSFKDAKMSLLEWSLSTSSITTISIHYYEREDFRSELLYCRDPEIRVDPTHRCAMLRFYGDYFAVLPFRQDDVLPLNDEENSGKWPYHPSFVLEAKKIDPRIRNVIDTAFLYDYFEPTLAILFEPQQTWPGRLSERSDTCCLLIVSLDVTKKVFPVIYYQDRLPFNCTQIIPMPRPVGGLLVVTADALIHLSQSSRAIGVAVNSFADKSTQFPIDSKAANQLQLVLEGCRVVFLDGTHSLLVTRDGACCILEFLMDGSRVRNLKLSKLSQRLVAPSCACTFADRKLFFLGSRLGDSLMVKYGSQPIGSKPKENGIGDRSWMPRRSTGEFDDELYGSTVDQHLNDHTSAMTFDFKICDRLLNTGPISDMAIGKVAKKNDQKDGDSEEVELVACSGYGHSGSLCIFQRSIRPHLTGTFDIPECEDVWTVHCRKDVLIDGMRIEEVKDRSDEMIIGYDEYLFVSKPKSTMVLAAGASFQELDRLGFYTDGPTVAVGTLFDDTRIVQVYSEGIRLLDADGNMMQMIPFTSNLEQTHIVAAHIVDPYVLISSENGRVTLLKGNDATKDLTFGDEISNQSGNPVISCNIFADVSNRFLTISEFSSLTQQLAKDARSSNKTQNSLPLAYSAGINRGNQFSGADADDDAIDMDLYGDSGATQELEEDVNMSEQLNETNVSMQNTTGVNEIKETRYYVAMYRRDRSLEILRLPNMEEVFCSSYFGTLPNILSDVAVRHHVQSSVNVGTESQAVELEVILANIGKTKMDPYLVVRTPEGEVAVYRAFRFIPDSIEETVAHRLAARFVRIPIDYIPSELKSTTASQPIATTNGISTNNPSHKGDSSAAMDSGKEVGTENNEEEEDIFLQKRKKAKYLMPFRGISGYTGVFVKGRQPVWLLSSGKSVARVHPMLSRYEGEVVAFTSFHNVNCHHGFLFVDKKSIVRLSEFPINNFTYDVDWPVQKIHLGRTLHRIVYHAAMQVYVVLSSVPEEFIQRDDNGEVVGQANKGLSPTLDRFSIELVSPVTWETVDRYEFAEYEQGLCLECVTLESKQTASGRKDFIAVGTGFFRGEDVAMRGCIYVFEIIEVVPEPNNPQTNHKFKQLISEEVRGPVSAICDIKGYLATSLGPKIIIRSFDDNENLVPVAFVDVQIHVTELVSVKNFLLVSDAFKSIWFCGFQEEPAKLVLLGKDFRPLEVVSSNFLIDDRSLYFAVSDAEKNLQLFQYAPLNLQSISGQRLLRRGDFHVGSTIKKFLRLPKRSLTDEGQPKQYLCLCGTLDGSLGLITPIPEKSFKRLQLLQGQLVNGLQHPAGLNPKAFRLLQSNERLASNPVKAVLDGDLIWQFLWCMPPVRRREMAKRIGTTVERIVTDLREIDFGWGYF
ncbi:uncharacterized protein VTP21DRAFT_291 [Calcarisporiella thermophila]|uniref:uncharacterized protein n=1 Tax=Calcarisporiella thermophila TaxID=911321 RepID=UPI0037423BC6